MNRFDKIVLNAGFIAITVFWLNYFIKDIVSAMFISTLIWIGAKTIFLHLTNRYGKLKNMSLSEVEQCFALMGVDECTKHFLKLFPETYDATTESAGYISYRENNTAAKKLLLVSLKFSAASADDIAKAWRYARDNGMEKITVLTKPVPRSLLIMARSLSVEFEFVEQRRLYKFLVRHNALPEKNHGLAQKKKKAKLPVKEIFSGAFSAKHTKLFILSGFSLTLLSLFTPLKIYYLITATLSFALAGVCYIRNHYTR